MILLLLLPKLVSAYLHKVKRYHRWRLVTSKFLVDLDRPVPIDLPPPNTWAHHFRRWQLRLQLIYTEFRYFIHASCYRLVTLASLPKTFYPLYIYGLYIVIGPFFIGELVPTAKLKDGQSITDAFGWFYLYGLFMEGQWVPIADTWLFGVFELAYCFAPLVVYLSFCITPPEQLYAIPHKLEDRKTRKADGMQPVVMDHGERSNPNCVDNVFFFPPLHDRRRYPLHRRYYVRFVVVAMILYQFTNVFFIAYVQSTIVSHVHCMYCVLYTYIYCGLYNDWCRFCYGPWAAVLCPGKTWFLVWSCFALYRHRWSFHGREIDLLTDSELKRLGYRGVSVEAMYQPPVQQRDSGVSGGSDGAIGTAVELATKRRRPT
jgi:hypothetical protein